MFCREQVAQLRDKAPAIRALGAEPAAVGNGKPHHAEAFQNEYKFDFPLLVDPELRAYAAAGLRRGVFKSFNFESIANAFRALGRGFRQGRTKGDPWQQGGTFVITPSGDVLFSHVSKVAGDHPDLEDVLTALRKHSGKG
jgi:peroxiredoxin